LPRLAGWFGNDPNTRFRLHLEPEFIPVPSADGWQISNPSIFAMAPLRASLSIFDRAGEMEPLRAKSIKLTGYLQFLLEQEWNIDILSVRPTGILPVENTARYKPAGHTGSKPMFRKSGSKRYSVVTPREPDARGCQLSIQAHQHPKELHKQLIAAGVKCDFREPNVVRVAPTPLYNTFHEVWRFAKILAEHQ
jgi:kynureninase